MADGPDNPATEMVPTPAVPNKNSESPTNKQVLAQITQSWSGPLPPPDVLLKYETIQAGFADRIITMTETEAAHVREMDNAVLRATAKEARLGQIFGFLIGTISIVAGSVTAIMGAPWPGGFIGTAGVVGLVYVFVKGREAQRPPS